MSDNRVSQEIATDEENVGRDVTSVTTATIKCNTSQPNCEGWAYFRNRSNGPVSYVIWYQDGKSGHSKFVLGAKSTHREKVRTGDKLSGVLGNDGVPDNAPRQWLKVEE